MSPWLSRTTLTVAEAVYLVPFTVIDAVTTAVPRPFAVTTPLLDTVATLVLLELHNTDLPDGTVVALIVAVLLTAMVKLLLSSVSEGPDGEFVESAAL